MRDCVEMISEEAGRLTGKRSVQKPKRGQANKRERVRTENVNVGFENLRKLIPTDPEDRKLSKIEVLRLATSYINHLYNLTRASSCIEAEEIDSQAFESSCSSSEEGEIAQQGAFRDETIRSKERSYSETQTKSKVMDTTRGKPANKSAKHHVCTFCLMMTKSTGTSTSTKRK